MVDSRIPAGVHIIRTDSHEDEGDFYMVCEILTPGAGASDIQKVRIYDMREARAVVKHLAERPNDLWMGTFSVA